MNSDTLKKMLEKKHKDDVFVTECHTGEARRGMLSFDAWVMRRSYSTPAMIGYEIKVDRSDFMQDKKWPGYLAFCNEFNFVCPQGLIHPEELNNDVGLLWVTKKGDSLRQKKKARWREIDERDVNAVLKYITITRADIKDSRFSVAARRNGTQVDKREYWEKWLENKKIDYRFGQMVGKGIAIALYKEIITKRGENAALKAENEALKVVKILCESFGIDIHRRWNIESSFTEKVLKMPPTVIQSVDKLLRDLGAFRTEMEKMNE